MNRRMLLATGSAMVGLSITGALGLRAILSSLGQTAPGAQEPSDFTRAYSITPGRKYALKVTAHPMFNSSPVLPMDIRVSRAVRPREVRVECRTSLADEAAARAEPTEKSTPIISTAVVLTRYLAALNAGCFGPGRGSHVLLSTRTDDGIRFDVWRLELSECHPEVLYPLAILARNSLMFGTGLHHLRLHETSTEDAEMLRTLPAPSMPKPPFRVRMELLPEHLGSEDIAESGRITVTFRREMSDATRSDIKALVSAWASFLWGGFDHHYWPCTAGFVHDPVEHSAMQIEWPLDNVAVSQSMWDALLRGLMHIHTEHQPIRIVKVA